MWRSTISNRLSSARCRSRSGAVNVLGEREFKAGILQSLLKLLELIRRPHLGNPEDIRMNFFDDPDQGRSFRVPV